MLGLLRRLLEGGFPELDWIQVEATTHCDANCIYCPRSAFQSGREPHHLSLEVFERLVPFFKNTRHVHLQGWGEPFAHPRLFDMLRIAKKAGCAVGTTTNGMLVDKEKAEAVVGEGLDVIAFSLAGVDERNDTVRRGAPLRQVLEAVELVQASKAKRGSEKPAVHVAYMLLRSGLEDLEKLPAFFGKAGIDQVVVSTLSLVVAPALEAETLRGLSSEEYANLRARLAGLRQDAAAAGVDMHFRLISPLARNDRCSENVERSLVVTAEGSVSPCVFTVNEPLRSRQLSFGSVLETGLDVIWNREDARRFRQAHSEGHPPQICADCPKLCVDDLSGS